VLDVHERYGQFWLKGAAADPSWVQRQQIEYWLGLEEHLDHQVWSEIGRVRQSFTSEVAVQAMLCTRASDLFSVVDRETVIGFPSTADRIATYERLQAPLRDAFPTRASAPWLVPKKFGGELDLLAVDPDGRLLAIEVKPGSATAGITWAPLQATFYARLLQSWAEEAGPESATIIERMLGQRVAVNLTPDPIRPVRVPLEVVPVVAISRGASKAAIERLHVVQETLLDAAAGFSTLEDWKVWDTVGRTRSTPWTSA